MNRPYTTAELLALLGNKHRSYVDVVIKNKNRKQPHPLAAAYLARGMWDRAIVDAYIATGLRPTKP